MPRTGDRSAHPDAFTTNRTGWATFTIGAFDSPNLVGLSLDDLLALADDELDQNARPYLVRRRWVREKSTSFDRIRGRCTLRSLRVEPSLPACDSYDADLE